jgi:hypothetical protein
MSTYKDILCKNMNKPIDTDKEILSINDRVLTKDKKIVGKLDKNSPIHKLLLQKPFIESSGSLYRHRGVTHMVQFPFGDQILFGNLMLDNDIGIMFRVCGIRYSRDHNPYREYTHLLK